MLTSKVLSSVSLYVTVSFIFFCVIGSTNSILNVTVDIGVHEVKCRFLNGPLTFANCTIQYGTDATYENLPNTDSSTGINVNSVRVPLSTPLQANTLYYYIVFSMGVCVQGTFHSGAYHISYVIGDKVNMK